MDITNYYGQVQEKIKDTLVDIKTTLTKSPISSKQISTKDIPFFSKSFASNTSSAVIEVFKKVGIEFFGWMKSGWDDVFGNIRSAYMNIMGDIHTTFISPSIAIGKSITESFKKFFLRQDKTDSEERGNKGKFMKMIMPVVMILGVAVGLIAAKIKLASDALMMPIKIIEGLFKIPAITLLSGKIGKFFTKIGTLFESFITLSKNPIIKKLGFSFISGFMKGFTKIFWPIQVLMSIFDLVKGYQNTEGSITDKIVGGLKSLFEGLISIVVEPFAWVINKIRGWMGFEAIPDLGSKMMDVLFIPIEGMFRYMVWMGGNIISVIEGIWNGVTGVYNFFVNLDEFFSNLTWDKVKDFIVGIPDKFMKSMKSFGDFLTELPNSLLEKAKSILPAWMRGDSTPTRPVSGIEAPQARQAKQAKQAKQARQAPQAPQAGAVTRYDKDILKFSKKHGVDPKLAKAVMMNESSGNPNAISPTGPVGLMQLSKAAASDMGVNRNIPEQNLEGGIKYLAWLSKRFGGDTDSIIAAYNMGPGAFAKSGGMLNAEASVYVPRVKRTMAGATIGNTNIPTTDISNDVTNNKIKSMGVNLEATKKLTGEVGKQTSVIKLQDSSKKTTIASTNSVIAPSSTVNNNNRPLSYDNEVSRLNSTFA